MRLTKDDKKICEKYSAYDGGDRVHCCECPLAVDTRLCLCKANLTAKEYRGYREGR